MSQNSTTEDTRAVAALIDHTLLKPEATSTDVAMVCGEAREWGFASVCVNPYWVKLAAELLAGSGPRVCTVIGFPLGANLTAAKLAEAESAIAQGAHELDMVQNIGALLSGDQDFVREEIRRLAALAHQHGAILKVILETCLLSDEQKVTAASLALDAAADFVKTSTGFSKAGATVHDVKLMRRTVDHKLGVKASGGVRTLEALRHMVRAGASRIGTSSGVSIMHELTATQSMHSPGQSEPPPQASY
ncbi:MAG: deoxyribose-phosphate aldolase [Acidobacteriaceae bacterium]|nr:deoxyribose-phosphate aldolase [Acidobacteriaceae bacterium]